MYCGYSTEPFGLRSEFTEAVPQIVRDIEAGYPHIAVAADGTHHPVAAHSDGLWADGMALANIPFARPHRHPLPETWLTWWQFALEDPFWYKQRQGR